MTAAFLLVTIGGIILVSSLKGISVPETLRNQFGKLDPSGGKIPDPTYDPSAPKDFTNLPNTLGGQTSAKGGPSPKSIIDAAVIPLANQYGIHVTAASVAAANAAHGPTVTGGRSDHQGPPDKAWAADMGNGRTTPEEDALAAALAKMFKIPWNGSGLKTKSVGNYRYQLIYRTMMGGDHFNHVHFGVEKVK